MIRKNTSVISGKRKIIAEQRPVVRSHEFLGLNWLGIRGKILKRWNRILIFEIYFRPAKDPKVIRQSRLIIWETRDPL